jgi:hypothetical protein
LKKRVNIFPIFLLVIIFLSVSYLETSSLDSLDSKETLIIGDNSNSDSETANAPFKEKNDAPKKNWILQLDQRMVKQERVDGYLVETYREYEMYKDRKGNVKDEIPTSNYDYIRYKINE